MLVETIIWQDAPSSLPDADLTVLVRTKNCEEPVWLGFWDGEVWRDTECVQIEVVRWADMPVGGES